MNTSTIIVNGPIISQAAIEDAVQRQARVIYSVYLSNGMVITSPEGFSSAGESAWNPYEDSIFVPLPPTGG